MDHAFNNIGHIPGHNYGNKGVPQSFLGMDARSAKLFMSVVLVVIFILSFISLSILPPSTFPVGRVIVIKKGMSLGEVSVLLKKESIIRSRVAFEACVTILDGDRKVVAEDYAFREPMGACVVAERVAKGISGIPATRITIPEGFSNREISKVLNENLQDFNEKVFLSRAQKKEGYLFPDTYFLKSITSAQEAIKLMEENFEKKIASIRPLISASGHSLQDIVIMASIIEKEALTEEDRGLISGILWKRIEMGMPLQVDAPFLYLLKKTSAELTQDDLKINSRYNTYLNKGLPVGPIGNPGIAALRAATMPTDSPYLYYLSDNNGVMHYAKNFEEHKNNKAKYIW